MAYTPPSNVIPGPACEAPPEEELRQWARTEPRFWPPHIAAHFRRFPPQIVVNFPDIGPRGPDGGPPEEDGRSEVDKLRDPANLLRRIVAIEARVAQLEAKLAQFFGDANTSEGSVYR